MRLSGRLRMVADMVKPCEAVADIGCDHAYLSVWLLREGIAKYAYACDVRKGPLAKAEETIRFFHMQERAKTVLCDGLAGITPGEAQVIVMAGMGGELTNRILREGKEVAEAAECLVLQPQSDWELVRRYVYDMGYAITDEQCTFEDGKYYVCMRAERAGEEKPYSDTEYRYGRILPEKGDVTYLAMLAAECEKKAAMLQRLASAGTESAEARIASATEELTELTCVIRKLSGAEAQ
ncbi:MAG: SAM-dependent methyltransferase [Lachnospiraceae bacterium]|nr:SAM-dependent methyltransferase [Lachnospiraceae bacterium]